MGSFRSFNILLHTNPPLPQETKVAFNLSHIPLLMDGLNMGVIVSTATIFSSSQNQPQPVGSAQILAHFDTGASITSIDIELAKQLNLIPVGQSPSNTAAGLRIAPNFVVDLSFPGTNLHPFQNLQISSCDLSGLSTPLRFKLLLGRDVMARWNIVWDGPSSNVIISD